MAGFELDFSAARITHFIFHVVHQGADEPVLLEETPLGRHEEFFLDRVRETVEGNRFVFNESSLVESELRDVHAEPSLFVDKTKSLARHFQSFKNENIKPGVVIFMTIDVRGQKVYSVIKYDHEEVLSYEINEGNRRAVLSEVRNSFTKSEKALHKSALIALTEPRSEVVVIDRKVRDDISKFFKGFLNVHRKYTEVELTQRIAEVTVETVKKHRSELPQEITGRIWDIIQSQVANQDRFEQVAYFDMVFGPHGTDDIRKSFGHLLDKNDLSGELFRFDVQNLSRPKKRKIRTREGIQISYDESASDTISFEEDGNTKKIIIETQQYDRL